MPVKPIAQQDLQSLGRIRERLITERTAIINQARGLAREYGVNLRKSREALMNELPLALADADNELSPIARAALRELLEEIRQRSARLKQHPAGITRSPRPIRHTSDCSRSPGIGPIIAPALLAKMGHGQQFHQRPQLLGLGRPGAAAKQHRRTRAAGQHHQERRSQLATLLIHGARTVVRWIDRRQDRARSVGQLLRDAARTKPSSRSPTNSCASPGRCSRKLSRSISPRRSAPQPAR